MREFDVIIEQDDEGWFIAHVPALRGCHTQAATLVELKSRLREAIGACLADDAENGNPVIFAKNFLFSAGCCRRDYCYCGNSFQNSALIYGDE